MTVAIQFASLAWERVSRESPCPICQQTHWCSISADREWSFCMRQESDRPSQTGTGWMHRLTEPSRPVDAPRVITGEERRSRGTSTLTRWPIADAAGNVVAIHGRRDFADHTKNLWWEMPDGGKGLRGLKPEDVPLYGVDELDAESRGIVVVTEGEKARDALAGLGIAAVGTVTGAASVPSPAVLSALRGRDVVLWPDNDDIGRAHMQRIAGRLRALGIRSTTLTWGTEKGDDAADFVLRGGDAEAVQSLISEVQTEVQTIDADSEIYASMGIYGPSRASMARSAACSASMPEGLTAGVTRLSTVQSERVRWVWPGRIPVGKITVVDGDPGLGKTTAILDIAARITTGRPMPDGAIGDLDGPRGVVILTAEDGLGDTIRPRLEVAGADLERVVAIEYVLDVEGRERMPSILMDLDQMERVIRYADAALVIVDPLMAYLGDAKDGADANRDQDVRRVLSPFGRMLERLGCAAMVIRHLRKADSGNAIYRGGGSIGIIGAARSGLIVALDPEDKTYIRRIIAVSKANLAAPALAMAYHLEGTPNGSARIVWEGTTNHTAIGLLGTVVTVEDRDQLDECETFLRQELWQEAGAPAREVQMRARTQGYSDKILRRARERLHVVSTRIGFGSSGVWMWSLPHPYVRDAPHSANGAHPDRAEPSTVEAF